MYPIHSPKEKQRQPEQREFFEFNQIFHMSSCSPGCQFAPNMETERPSTSLAVTSSSLRPPLYGDILAFLVRVNPRPCWGHIQDYPL